MKVCGRILFLIIAIIIISFFFSCEHRPLEDPHNGHYVRVYIDENIKNVTCGFYDESRNKPEYIRPKVLRVVLTDPTTDNVVTERYLQSFGEDERGYYVDGYIAAAEGEYNLMIYNFGSGRTKIRNEYSFYNMQAYTSPISESYYPYFPNMPDTIDKTNWRYCPDHLFVVTSQPIKINCNKELDTLYDAEGNFFMAKSVVKSYYLQIRINGFEYVTSAVSLLSGMAGTTTLNTKEMDESDAVSLFFDMNYAEVTKTKSGSASKSAVLYTTFNTFGKLYDKKNIYMINFEFTRTDGTSQIETINITSMFDEPMVKNEQWILIDQEIEIKPTEGAGGMRPGVDVWDDIICDIPL